MSRHAEPHAARRRQHGDLVGHRPHRREPDAEPADRARAVGSSRLADARIDASDATPVGVERGARVRGDEHQRAVVGARQPQQQPARDARARRPRRRRSARARRPRGRGSSRGRGPPRCWRPPAAGPGTTRHAPRTAARRAAVPKASAVTAPGRGARRLVVGSEARVVGGVVGRGVGGSSAAASTASALDRGRRRRRPRVDVVGVGSSAASSSRLGARPRRPALVSDVAPRRRRPRRRTSSAASASAGALGGRPSTRLVGDASVTASRLDGDRASAGVRRRPTRRGRPARGCSSSISGSGAGQSVGGASASVSECAPQPWSTLTTVPSSGDHSLAQTPNTVPSEPCSGTRNPQLPHAAADASEPALVGPCEPRYQRSAASSRPCGDSTRTRASASSSIATSSSSGSPVGVQPGSSRGSSARNGRTSPGPMSPGRRRSDHGSQAWPRTASAPGSSSASQTVAVRPRGHAGDRDGPLPAAVAAGGRREPVGDQPLALDDEAEVLADVGGVLGQPIATSRARSTAEPRTASFVAAGHAQASMSSATARSRVAYCAPRAFSG